MVLCRPTLTLRVDSKTMRSIGAKLLRANTGCQKITSKSTSNQMLTMNIAHHSGYESRPQSPKPPERNHEHHRHLRARRAAAVPAHADVRLLVDRQARRDGQDRQAARHRGSSRVRREPRGRAPSRKTLVGVGGSRRLRAPRRGPASADGGRAAATGLRVPDRSAQGATARHRASPRGHLEAAAGADYESDCGSDGMSDHYILDGHQAVPVDLMTWAHWFEKAERHVANEMIGDVRISTVFLGLDHRYGDDGPPLLFETMVF